LHHIQFLSYNVGLFGTRESWLVVSKIHKSKYPNTDRGLLAVLIKFMRLVLV